MSDMVRLAKTVGAVVVLVALLLFVVNLLSDYRAAGDSSAPETDAVEQLDEGETPEDASGETSGTVPADVESLGTVTVVIDGLNFRVEPSASGALIRGLDEGDVLEYLGGAEGWYHVRASDGTEGYVSASEQYTTLEMK